MSLASLRNITVLNAAVFLAPYFCSFSNKSHKETFYLFSDILPLRGKFPNTEFLLVRISLYSD